MKDEPVQDVKGHKRRRLRDDLGGVAEEDCESFKGLWGVLRKLGWSSCKRADIESSFAYCRPGGRNGEKGLDWYPSETALVNAVSCSCCGVCEER